MNHTEATAAIKSHISFFNSLHVKLQKMEDYCLPEVFHHLFYSLCTLICTTELLHLNSCKGSKPIIDIKLKSSTTPLYFYREWLHFGVKKLPVTENATVSR